MIANTAKPGFRNGEGYRHLATFSVPTRGWGRVVSSSNGVWGRENFVNKIKDKPVHTLKIYYNCVVIEWPNAARQLGIIDSV